MTEFWTVPAYTPYICGYSIEPVDRLTWCNGGTKVPNHCNIVRQDKK